MDEIAMRICPRCNQEKFVCIDFGRVDKNNKFCLNCRKEERHLRRPLKPSKYRWCDYKDAKFGKRHAIDGLLDC
jgi:hypothetical protein